MTGVELIAAERARQQDELGYDVSHDVDHENDELANAGAWYALEPRTRSRLDHMNNPRFDGMRPGQIWPEGWVFRGNTSRIRELQKAGALIAAEIDRRIALGETD